MQSKKYIFSITFILIALFLSCEDKEWKNPFDANSDPKSWAPENLQIEQLSVTKVKLTWEQEEDNISGFKIDRKIGEESWQIEYAILDTNLTEWIDITAVPDSMIYYRIYAFAKSNKSSIVENSICPEFPAPTDLQIQQLSVTELKLAWQDNSNGEDGFKVDKKVGNGAWQICYGIIKSNNTSWTDANAVSDQLNYYRLYAYVGDSKSSSVENSINPSFPAPSNLQVNQLSDVEVKLTWQDNSAGEDGFKIDKKVGSGNWILSFGIVGSNIEEWIDAEPVLSEINYYRVYGYSGENKSSEIEGDITLSFPAPTNLTAYPISDSEIGITWIDNCSFETGYKIERRENDGDFIQISEVSSNITEFIDSGLIYSSNYHYRVKAFIDMNHSTYSNEAIASPYKVKNITQCTYHENIQAAILSSIDGDTIMVKPGCYVENINFFGKSIFIGSLFITTGDTSYISNTIIDGNQNGSVITFQSGEDSTSVLCGFTITNGSSQEGGGIYCGSSSNPKLKYINIIGNNGVMVILGGYFVKKWSVILIFLSILRPE